MRCCRRRATRANGRGGTRASSVPLGVFAQGAVVGGSCDAEELGDLGDGLVGILEHAFGGFGLIR